MNSSKWKTFTTYVFKETYIDQLQKLSAGNVETEIHHVYKYLQQPDNCRDSLREVKDFKKFEKLLDLPEAEVEKILQSTVDQHSRVYYMVKAFASSTYHAMQTARNFSEDSITTSTSQITEPNEKQCLVPQTRFAQIKLKHYISPNHQGFVETADFESLKNSLALRSVYKVYHIFGMSGTGKSQLVRKICYYIDSNHPEYIIWHVQCPQVEACLLKQFQRFLDCLKTKTGTPSLIDDIKNAFEDLKEGNTKSFVDVLSGLTHKVLILLEDVSHQQDKGFVRDLLNQILSGQQENVQLVLVTKKADAFSPDDKISDHNDFTLIKIQGFSEQEAVDFLAQRKSSENDEIADLAGELAYSPFRLYLARCYCSKYKVSYKDYYAGLGKDENIVEREKELLLEHPEFGKHTYEVVTKMLETRPEDQMIQKEVVKMMSFLNNVAIPDLLLGKFLREAKDDIQDVEEESRMVKELLLTLENDFDAAVNEFGGSGYGEKIVSMIHSDILTAVRFSMDNTERKRVISKVLQAIVSSVGKDNRKTKSNILLSDMMNHFGRVSEFAEKLLSNDIKSDEASGDNFRILMCLSRLYEVSEFAATQTSNVSRDDRYEYATAYLWRIACDHAVKSSISRLTLRNNDMSSQLCYKEDKDPEQTAQKVYEALTRASRNAECEELCDRFFPLTMDLVKGMKQKCQDVDWDAIEGQITKMKPLTAEQYDVLRSRGCLLKPEVLRKVFLVECLASILHSRGRQLMYIKNSISMEERKRYEWYTDLGIHLCEIMHEKTGVNSIFGYMLKANNRLHRLLLAPPGLESDKDFLSRLNEARSMAKTALDVDGDFYEHGKFKLVPGNPFTKLNALKCMVRANTKVHKRQHVVEFFESETDITACDQLYHVSKCHAQHFPFASNCMIQVAKYLAATGNYDHAMTAVENGFSFKGNGINHRRENNVVNYAWALHNSGRVLYASKGEVHNFNNHCSKFFARYRNLIAHKGDALPEWREKLDDIKVKVESLVGSRSLSKSTKFSSNSY